MMRSLYSGVTGLRNHQTKMDVIATIFKRQNIGKIGRIDIGYYSQIIKRFKQDRSADNPQQIGLVLVTTRNSNSADQATPRIG